jgi:hypothetical protein
MTLQLRRGETESTILPIVPTPDDVWWCVEQSVKWMAGEPEILGENLSQCRFVRYKSHMTRPAVEHEPPRWEAGD